MIEKLFKFARSIHLIVAAAIVLQAIPSSNAGTFYSVPKEKHEAIQRDADRNTPLVFEKGQKESLLNFLRETREFSAPTTNKFNALSSIRKRLSTGFRPLFVFHQAFLLTPSTLSLPPPAAASV